MKPTPISSRTFGDVALSSESRSQQGDKGNASAMPLPPVASERHPKARASSVLRADSVTRGIHAQVASRKRAETLQSKRKEKDSLYPLRKENQSFKNRFGSFSEANRAWIYQGLGFSAIGRGLAAAEKNFGVFNDSFANGPFAGFSISSALLLLMDGYNKWDQLRQFLLQTEELRAKLSHDYDKLARLKLALLCLNKKAAIRENAVQYVDLLETYDRLLGNRVELKSLKTGSRAMIENEIAAIEKEIVSGTAAIREKEEEFAVRYLRTVRDTGLNSLNAISIGVAGGMEFAALAEKASIALSFNGAAVAPIGMMDVWDGRNEKKQARLLKTKLRPELLLGIGLEYGLPLLSGRNNLYANAVRVYNACKFRFLRQQRRNLQVGTLRQGKGAVNSVAGVLIVVPITQPFGQAVQGGNAVPWYGVVIPYAVHSRRRAKFQAKKRAVAARNYVRTHGWRETRRLLAASFAPHPHHLDHRHDNPRNLAANEFLHFGVLADDLLEGMVFQSDDNPDAEINLAETMEFLTAIKLDTNTYEPLLKKARVEVEKSPDEAEAIVEKARLELTEIIARKFRVTVFKERSVKYAEATPKNFFARGRVIHYLHKRLIGSPEADNARKFFGAAVLSELCPVDVEDFAYDAPSDIPSMRDEPRQRIDDESIEEVQVVDEDAASEDRDEPRRREEGDLGIVRNALEACATEEGKTSKTGRKSLDKLKSRWKLADLHEVLYYIIEHHGMKNENALFAAPAVQALVAAIRLLQADLGEEKEAATDVSVSASDLAKLPEDGGRRSETSKYRAARPIDGNEPAAGQIDQIKEARAIAEMVTGLRALIRKYACKTYNFNTMTQRDFQPEKTTSKAYNRVSQSDTNIFNRKSELRLDLVMGILLEEIDKAGIDLEEVRNALRAKLDERFGKYITWGDEHGYVRATEKRLFDAAETLFTFRTMHAKDAIQADKEEHGRPRGTRGSADEGSAGEVEERRSASAELIPEDEEQEDVRIFESNEDPAADPDAEIPRNVELPPSASSRETARIIYKALAELYPKSLDPLAAFMGGVGSASPLEAAVKRTKVLEALALRAVGRADLEKFRDEMTDHRKAVNWFARDKRSEQWHDVGRMNRVGKCFNLLIDVAGVLASPLPLELAFANEASLKPKPGAKPDSPAKQARAAIRKAAANKPPELAAAKQSRLADALLLAEVLTAHFPIFKSVGDRVNHAWDHLWGSSRRPADSKARDNHTLDLKIDWMSIQKKVMKFDGWNQKRLSAALETLSSLESAGTNVTVGTAALDVLLKVDAELDNASEETLKKLKILVEIRSVIKHHAGVKKLKEWAAESPHPHRFIFKKAQTAKYSKAKYLHASWKICLELLVMHGISLPDITESSIYILGQQKHGRCGAAMARLAGACQDLVIAMGMLEEDKKTLEGGDKRRVRFESPYQKLILGNLGAFDRDSEGDGDGDSEGDGKVHSDAGNESDSRIKSDPNVEYDPDSASERQFIESDPPSPSPSFLTEERPPFEDAWHEPGTAAFSSQKLPEIQKKKKSWDDRPTRPKRTVGLRAQRKTRTQTHGKKPFLSESVTGTLPTPLNFYCEKQNPLEPLCGIHSGNALAMYLTNDSSKILKKSDPILRTAIHANRGRVPLYDYALAYNSNRQGNEPVLVVRTLTRLGGVSGEPNVSDENAFNEFLSVVAALPEEEMIEQLKTISSQPPLRPVEMTFSWGGPEPDLDVDAIALTVRTTVGTDAGDHSIALVKGADGQFHILDSIGQRTIPTYATAMNTAAKLTMTLYTQHLADDVPLSWDIMMPVPEPSQKEAARLRHWIDALNRMHDSHRYENRMGKDGLREAGYEDALHIELRDFLDEEGVPADKASRARELGAVHRECLRSMGEMQADIRRNKEAIERLDAISSMIETCIGNLQIQGN